MAFDPNQPFEEVEEVGFDPNLPFELVEEPAGTSVEQEVSQLGAALKSGIAQPLQAMGVTAETLGMPAVGAALKGAVEQPEGYVPAAQRFMEPQAGEAQLGGFAFQYLPRAIVEQVGQLAGSVASRAAGGVIGGAAGSVVPGAGTAVGAGIGMFTGPALFEAAQIVGPVAQERAKNNGREIPNSEDLAYAWTTAGTSGALNAIGTKYLPGGEKAVGALTKRIAASFLGEGATEGAQALAQQTGETILTEKGLEIQPKAALGEALIGGVSAGGATIVMSPLQKEQVDIEKEADLESRDLSIPVDDPEVRANLDKANILEQENKDSLAIINKFGVESEEGKAAQQTIVDNTDEITKINETLPTGLSLPITTAEQQQIELAKEIAAPAEKKVRLPAMPSIEEQTAEAAYGGEPGVFDVFGAATRKPARLPKELARPTIPSIAEQEAGMVYGGETGVYDAFGGVRRRPAPPVAEAPAVKPAPVEEVEFAELRNLMERRGQAQGKVKGVKFSKKDEARYNELLPKYRSQLLETITPEADPIVWKDIQGNDIKVSQKGTFYTLENGRVRTGPAFQSEGFIKDVSPQPVSAAVVESNNVPLPEGYTKQGDVYVYQAPVAETPAVTEAPAEEVAPTIEEQVLSIVPPETLAEIDKIPNFSKLVRKNTPLFGLKASYLSARKKTSKITNAEIKRVMDDVEIQTPLQIENTLRSLLEERKISTQNKKNKKEKIKNALAAYGDNEILDRAIIQYEGSLKELQNYASLGEAIGGSAGKANAIAARNRIREKISSDETELVNAYDRTILSKAPAVSETITPAAPEGNAEAIKFADEALRERDKEVGRYKKKADVERKAGREEMAQRYEGIIDDLMSVPANEFKQDVIENPAYYIESNVDPFLRFKNKEVNRAAPLTPSKRKREAGGVLIPSREDLIQAGQNIYEAGMEFGSWAKQMVQRFGDAVRQFLADVWEAVSGFPAKLEEMAGYLPGKGERGAVTFGRGEEPPKKPAKQAPQKPITDPVTPDEQTQQLVQQAQEQESLVDSAVKEAGTTVFDVFNKLVNEGKTEDQVAKELGISNYDVRKYKLRADTAILNKMKQKKVKPLAFAPKNPVAEFAEKNLRKYFTKEGWLPKAVFQSWVKRNAALSREQKEAEFAIKDLYAGIREVFGISKMEMIAKGLVSVPPEFVQQLNDALAGKIDINTMPEPVREPLTRMRQHIDAMSRQLVDLNVLPDELSAKISENLGVYLTRSYKIFTDKNWINKIPTEKLTAARNFLYQQQLKNDPEATIEIADRELRNMLNDWASDAEGLRKRGGKLGAKDLTVMMERAKVPKVLREVMGENTNVIFNYANTIGKISRFVSDQKFLNEVKAKGTGEFLFTEKDAPKGFNTQIAAEESRTMSPLNGLRTTPEIAKAFEEFGKGYDARENPGLYVLAWLNAVGKLNLTVGSVLTQMRNMLGQPAFFVFNGHYNWRVIRQEIDAIAKEKGISQEDAKRELVKLAAGQGLVNENAYAGELRTAFQDVGLETFDDIGPDEFTKQFVLTRMYLKGVKSAQELYQKTDEFGKLVGWLNETKRIQRMNKGMDKQTAQSIAAERTRDTYPTYSQSSEALRLFRRQPFVGPFATFFYETFRTSFHNLRYAFEDINGPTPEHKAEGIKRLAGAMTTLSMGAFGINLLSKLASGIGDEEEEDVRRMLPPWAKDASLAWMPKSKDGTYNFINVSYINPYNAMTDPFIAMMSGFAKGDKPEEIAAQALGSFLSPFSSEQPVTATIADAMRNRTETGKQVYNPQDDITTKTSKIMLHIFGKTFTPGTITRLRERIIPAIQGETVGTRAPAPAKEIAAELTGIRFETLDMKAAFSNKAWEFSRAANESERIFRDVATRRRRVDEQEQVDAYRRSEQTRYEIWNDMYRDYMAVRRAGASPAEAIRLMTDIGISKKEAIAISKGCYVPYQVSDEVLRRSKLNENKVPIKEIRAIGKEMPKVLTDISKTP